MANPKWVQNKKLDKKWIKKGITREIYRVWPYKPVKCSPKVNVIRGEIQVDAAGFPTMTALEKTSLAYANERIQKWQEELEKECPKGCNCATLSGPHKIINYHHNHRLTVDPHSGGVNIGVWYYLTCDPCKEKKRARQYRKQSPRTKKRRR